MKALFNLFATTFSNYKCCYLQYIRDYICRNIFGTRLSTCTHLDMNGTNRRIQRTLQLLLLLLRFFVLILPHTLLSQQLRDV